MTTQSTLAVLGGGNMGLAILRGLARHPQPSAPAVLAYDPDPARQQDLTTIAGVQVASSPAEAIEPADVVLLAVKPQVMAQAVGPIAPLAGGKLFVSIAAGTPTARLEAWLPGGRVVRAMPNTPLMAGRGVVGLCRGATATEADLATARRLFPGATLVVVDENRMDAVTAISGSGPAYFFAFVEALAAAAEREGFDRHTAYHLSAETFLGAARLLEQSDESAATLRQRVTSPGGTTAAALEALAHGGLDRIVAEAVRAAADRGRELSQ